MIIAAGRITFCRMPMKSYAALMLCMWMFPLSAKVMRWSELSTWQQPGFRVAICSDADCLCAAMVPIEGKSVVIPAGARVLLDVDTPVLNGLMIHGELLFEDVPGVGLSAHWIMIMGEGSALRVGREDAPYVSRTHITLHGTDIQGNVSGQAPPWDSGSKFLMAMDGGTLALHGASRSKTAWTLLDAHARPGDTWITLDEAETGWQPGDWLVIGPSGFDYRLSSEVEVVSIAGNQVQIHPPLAHAHWGERMSFGGQEVDQRAPVGLLSRNILVQGAADSLRLRSELPDFPGYGPYTDLPMDVPLNFGAHVMIMGGLDDTMAKAAAMIEGVEFTRTGQTSLQGRYTFHWHWVGDAEGQYFRNNSVHHAFQRAVNIHRSSGVLVADNVSFRVMNHNYVWAEDGHVSEFNNRFLRNLAVGALGQSHSVHPMAFGDRGTQAFRRGTGPSQIKQEEWRSSAFWGRNLPHTLEVNHVAGVMNGMGFFYDIGGGNHPEPRLHQFRFANNTVHGVSDIHSGLNINNDLYPPATVGSALFVRNRNSGELEFSGLNAFHNKLGVWLESDTHTVRHAVLSDNGGAIMMFQGRIEESLLVGVSENRLGEEELLVRGRSPRRINALNAESAGLFIFGGQGGQKSIKATNLQIFQMPGGAIRSNDIYTFHGSYFSGLEIDDASLPLRMTGLGEGAFLDLDGLLDPDQLGRPTWLTFGDPNFITARSRFDPRLDAWRTPERGTIVRFDAADLQPFGPAAAQTRLFEHGLALELVGRGGVRIPLDYTVTPNTVIEFRSRDNQLYDSKNWNWVGIGLVGPDGSPDTARLFGVFGDRNAPFPAFSTAHTRQYLKPTGGNSPPFASFRIPIGQYYTGELQQLALYGHTNGERGDQAIFRFHLVRIYEQDAHFFRGWPVTRHVFEHVPRANPDRLLLSDLTGDPRYPQAPTSTYRVAPNYGGGAMHSYGNTALHERIIRRQHMDAAMVDFSYVVPPETGWYQFTADTQALAVMLQIDPVLGPENPPVLLADPGAGQFHGPREVTGSIYLEAGKVYRWRHTVLNRFGAAPTAHMLYWQTPGMAERQTMDLDVFRPGPGPRAPDEPAVASALNDRIPDAWKLENGIDPFREVPEIMASGSYLGDGISNWTRYVAGVGVRDRDRLPEARLRALPASRMAVEFPANPRRRYVLETSTDLQTWGAVSDPVQTGEAAEDLLWDVLADDAEKMFFRVRIEIPEPY